MAREFLQLVPYCASNGCVLLHLTRSRLLWLRLSCTRLLGVLHDIFPLSRGFTFLLHNFSAACLIFCRVLVGSIVHIWRVGKPLWNAKVPKRISIEIFMLVLIILDWWTSRFLSSIQALMRWSLCDNLQVLSMVYHDQTQHTVIVFHVAMRVSHG